MVTISKETLYQIRECAINGLEETISICTQNGTVAWRQEGACRDLIERIRTKVPFQMPGLFFGGVLGDAITKQGFPDWGPQKKEHMEIWEAIEKGE